MCAVSGSWVTGDGRLGLCRLYRIRAGQLPNEQLAHLREVAGDAVLLPGELVDLALGRDAAALSIGFDLGEQLLGLGLGLADDLVGVLLGVADQQPGVLVGVLAGLIGLGAGLGRVLTVENDDSVVVAFGSRNVQIMWPYAKLTKL